MAETHQIPDTNGWIEVRDNPLSKIGVYDYSGEVIPLPGVDPTARYAVLRPEEELSSPETLDSARLLPWIDDHPPALLGKEEDGNVLPEKKGIGGVTGEDIYFKDGVLYGNIKFLTDALAEQYRQGKKQLSMGYACDYVPESGVFAGKPYQFRQANIRFNHLALVENGRMGKEVAVLDSIDKEIFEMKDQDRVKLIEQAIAALSALAESYKSAPAGESETPPAEPGGEAAPAPAPANEDDPAAPAKDAAPAPSEILIEAAKAVIEAAQAEEAPAQPAAPKPPETADAEGEEKKPGAAAEPAPPAGGEEEKPASGMDSLDSVVRHLAARDKLAAALKPHIGTFDHAEMTISDVAQYGNKKLGLKAAPGKEFAMLQGYLAAKRPKTPAAMAMDAAPQETFIDQYLKGGK
jgi:hypothetical protein